MRPLLTTAIAGALALATGAALAALEQRVPPAISVDHVLRCAGGVDASALAQDFGDGPRLPLSAIGIRAGVIVAVTGRNINIVRRDGTEMRVKGLLPGDLPAAGDERKPLIRNSEVWVRAEELPHLLGRRCTCGTAPAQVAHASLDAPADFEAFEVPSPTIIKPSPAPRPVWRPRALPALPDEQDQEGGWVEVAPVQTTLALSRWGGIGGPGLTGSFQEVWEPSLFARRDRNRNLDPESPVSRVLSYLTMEAEEGRYRYYAGDRYHPRAGWGTGIGFMSQVSAGAELGASFVAPADLPGQDQEGQLALQARLQPSRSLSLESAVAVDGRYHALARLQQPGLSLLSSLLELPDREHRDIWWQKDISRGLAFVGRALSTTGDYHGNARSLGLRWDRDLWHLAVAREQTVLDDDRTGSSSFSALWLRPHLLASVQYRLEHGADGGSELECTIARTDPAGRQLSLSARRQSGGSSLYRLSASLPLNPQLRARASLELGAAGGCPDLRLEWRRSHDHLIVLRYGSSYADPLEAAPEPVFALYATLAFGRTRPGGLGDCRIVGSVKNDAGEGVPDVVVLLDETAEALTDATGQFVFDGVEEGAHHVHLDSGRLHADLASDCRPAIVVPTAAAPAEAQFLVIRLCEVAGSVLVAPPSGASPAEPLAGVRVQCQAADALASQPLYATTDEQGRYRFTGLRGGRYVVSLSSDQQLGPLTPLPPSEWSFLLQPGDKVSGANFTLRRTTRPVVFMELTASSP